MKSRPILMSAPMIKAILAGTKSQTRRAVKPQPQEHPGMECTRLTFFHKNGKPAGDIALTAPTPGPEIFAPWAAGEHLWVRETGWERPERTPKMMREGADTWERYYYDADGLTEADSEDFKRWGFKRRPSIFMPRWASRITLEVIGVRVERLQTISESDAIAEGIIPHTRGGWHWHLHNPADVRDWHQFGFKTAVRAYQDLWTEINGAASWDVDPWCWVVEFKRVTP